MRLFDFITDFNTGKLIDIKEVKFLYKKIKRKTPKRIYLGGTVNGLHTHVYHESEKQAFIFYNNFNLNN